MAFNAYLKFTPEVKGEAEAKGFENQIEILSFSWGLSNPTTVQLGSGGSSGGKADFGAFNVMTKTSLASGSLFQACASGKHYDKAEVVLNKSTGGDPLKYLTIKFDEVFVNSFQWAGSTGGDDTPMESISFTYAKCEFTYQQQDAKGLSKATSGGGWDIRKGTPLGKK